MSDSQVEMIALDAVIEKTGFVLPFEDPNNNKYTIDQFSRMGETWQAYCQDTLDELTKIRFGTGSTWLVKVEDAGYASHLIWDLIEMTNYVPFEGEELNMKHIVYNYLIVCPKYHDLAKFFK